MKKYLKYTAFILPFYVSYSGFFLARDIRASWEFLKRHRTKTDTALIKTDAKELHLLEEIAADEQVTDDELWRYGAQLGLVYQESDDDTLSGTNDVKRKNKTVNEPWNIERISLQRTFLHSEDNSLDSIIKRTKAHHNNTIFAALNSPEKPPAAHVYAIERFEESSLSFQKAQAKIGMKNVPVALHDWDVSPGCFSGKAFFLNVRGLHLSKDEKDYLAFHEVGHCWQYTNHPIRFFYRTMENNVRNLCGIPPSRACEDEADSLAAVLDPRNVRAAFMFFFHGKELMEEGFYGRLNALRSKHDPTDTHSCDVERVKNMIRVSARHQRKLHGPN